MRLIVWFALSLSVLSGCVSQQVQQCLATPVSNKIADGAVAQCRQALRSNMDRRDVFHRYVALLRVRGRYGELVTTSQEVLEHDGARTDALYNLAYGLRKTGNCQQAIKKYQAYAELNAKDPDPYFGIGLCHEDLGDRAAAIQAFTTYVEKEQRKGQEEWVQRARTRIAALQGGAPPVVAAATAAPAAAAPAPAAPAAPATPAPVPAAPAPVPTPAAPAPAAPAAASTDCSAHQQKFKADPFNTDAYELFAQCALAAGQNDEVVKYMRIATRDNPDFMRGFYHMARAYKAKGEADRAKGYFAKACSAGIAEACAGQ